MLCAMLLGVLVVQEPPPVAPASPAATLLVEIVVDRYWETLPGVTVTVIKRANRKERYTATTDENGIARFSVPKGAEYEIEATADGFKKGRVHSMQLGFGLITKLAPGQTLSDGQVRQAPPPRVQIRLTPSGS